MSSQRAPPEAPAGSGPAPCELTVLLLAYNEAENLRDLLPRVRGVLASLGVSWEILVVDGGSTDGTHEAAIWAGATVWAQRERGYGAALWEGLSRARGAYVATLDADVSHDPWFLRDLWEVRSRADLVIASRYVEGGLSAAGWLRGLLSRALNGVYRAVLSLPVRDLSSGFRLYRRAALREVAVSGRDFEALPELLVRLWNRGFRVVEVPFHYRPRARGVSKARLFRFGWRLGLMLLRLWKTRNDASAADYDDRAYSSRIFLQRAWQRQRYRIVMELCDLRSHVLDVGAGSSRIALGLPQGIAVDPDVAKLRFLRGRGRRCVRARAEALPFRDAAFASAIFSEVIEHIEPAEPAVGDLARVVAPGGTLVFGTPDCSRFFWRALEVAYQFVHPRGHLQYHVQRYTLRSARALLERHGFSVRRARYVYGAELIFQARRCGRPRR